MFGCSAYEWEFQLVREAVAYGSLLNDSEKQACVLSLNAPGRKAMIQILHIHVSAICIYIFDAYIHMDILMIYNDHFKLRIWRLHHKSIPFHICRPWCYVVLVAGCTPFGQLPVRLCLRAYTSINSNHGSLDGRGWWRHYSARGRVLWLCGFAVCILRVGIS